MVSRTEESSLSKDKKFCECGCGTIISKYNCRKQIKRFEKCHNVVNFIKHGPEHPSWKCGRTLDKDGYWLVWKEEYHAYRTGKYVLEHRLVYEEYHKCCVLPWIVVHHINGIITDNRIENLMTVTREEHNIIHKRIKLPVHSNNGN